MEKLFGTDGIRAKANTYPLLPSMLTSIGRAVAFALSDGKGTTMVVGSDTRLSSCMIKSAINSGICSYGVHVMDVDEIPTPGVAYLTSTTPSAIGGIVISASHNPFYDNGIKVFDSKGFKLSDQLEGEIEELIFAQDSSRHDQGGEAVGRVASIADADGRYQRFLGNCWPNDLNLNGLKIVIDCANGATHSIAPRLFESLGAKIIALGIGPDGQNINDHCGSEHPRQVAQKVVDSKADLGVAFDGDGDRLVAVDESGQILTGDQVLAILAHYLKSENKLCNNAVVSTIMSNIGLSLALNEMEIKHHATDVGDRRVMQKMREVDAILGGEDSGHVICLDQHTTGDGMLSALRLLEVMVRSGQTLSALAKIMTVSPQTLVNVPVQSKPELNGVEPIQAEIRAVEAALNQKGRVLVRYSGTQSLCRIMVEGPFHEITESYCRRIAAVVKESIG